jgi:hypothetical protein
MKTFPQKLYSFLGIWRYEEITMEKDGTYKYYLIIYWCIWPWKFKRKIDLFRINRTPKYQKHLQRRRKLIQDDQHEQYNEGY